MIPDNFELLTLQKDEILKSDTTKDKIMLLTGELVVYSNLNQFISSINEKQIFTIQQIKQRESKNLGIIIIKAEALCKLLIYSEKSQKSMIKKGTTRRKSVNFIVNMTDQDELEDIKEEKTVSKFLDNDITNITINIEPQYLFFKNLSFFDEQLKTIQYKLYNQKSKLNDDLMTAIGVKPRTSIYQIKQTIKQSGFNDILTKIESDYNLKTLNFPVLEDKITKYHNTLYFKYSNSSIKNILYYILITSLINNINNFEKILSNYKLKAFLNYLTSTENHIKYYDLKGIIKTNSEYKNFIVKRIIAKYNIKAKFKQIKEKSRLIAENSIKYKKEHFKIYNNLLCLKCKKRPKNVLPPCGHIVICETCAKKVVICLKCGNDTPNYIKLFRC